MIHKDGSERYRVCLPCMGSLLEITAYGSSVEECKKPVEAAFEEVRRIEGLLSPFDPESELSFVNRNAASGPVKVGPELAFLVRQCLDFARYSGGALDLTVAPLMKLWGFRNRQDLKFPPSAPDIAMTIKTVGYENLDVDAKRSTLEYRSRGIEIEFGAVGKGYAIDRAVEVLKKRGVTRALVSFGSAAYALGSPPGLDGWRLAVRHSREKGSMMEAVVLKNRAIASSGIYEQSVRLEGKRYGHIIDPRSGRPVRGEGGVSVVAQTALEADAFSTAAFVLGPGPGLKLLKNRAGVESFRAGGKRNGRIMGGRPGSFSGFGGKNRSRVSLGRRRFLAACLGVMGFIMVNPRQVLAVRYLTREEALRRLMPEAEKFIEENVTLTPAQKTKAETLTGKKFRKNTYTFWTGARNGDRLGYAVLLDVIGKERPITFMIAISPEGKTLGVEVLVFRESQGSEVRSKWFMRQFVGKSVGAVLKLGRDIDAVSGATMSSRSAAYAVKKSLALVETVYKSGKE